MGIAIVDDDRAFGRVVVGEEERRGGVVVAKRRHPAKGIAVGGFDEYDVGTEIGQQPRAVRADRTTEVDDAYAVESGVSECHGRGCRIASSRKSSAGAGDRVPRTLADRIAVDR